MSLDDLAQSDDPSLVMIWVCVQLQNGKTADEILDLLWEQRRLKAESQG